MSYKEWKRRTDVVGHPRSKLLQAVDEALKRYDSFNGADFLASLKQALDAWKKAQGPGNAWVRSIRNRNGAVSDLTAQLAGQDSDAALGLTPQFMQPHVEHARLGVLYLLSRLSVRPDIFSVCLESGLSIVGGVLSYHGGKIEDGGLGNATVNAAQQFFNAAMVPGSVALSGVGSQAQQLRLPPSQKQTLLMRVRAMFEEFAKKCWEAIKEKFGSIEFPIAAIKNLVNTCTGILTDVTTAGLVGGAMDLFKGTVNLVDGVIQKVRAWIRSKGVIVASGHPAIIVQSIQRAMNLSLMEGLWQTMKGGMNLGLAFATWGTSMIVTIVVACFELIVKVVWRLVELSRMKKLFDQAAEWWNQRDTANALHKHPAAFTNWFRKHALTLPAVAVLVHNSGICGDKMVYLSMYDYMLTAQNDDLAKKFAKGVEYLDFLKSWGVTYLNKCGFSFFSKDEFVNSLLAFATRPDAHAIPTSRVTQFWEKIVVPIANA
jgi:hypothetical protein